MTRAAITSSASRPVPASPTTVIIPLLSNPLVTPSRKNGWSSAMTTVTFLSDERTP